MAYKFFRDSRHKSYEVCMQQDPMSCGIACVAMIENIVKHTRGYNETTLQEKSQDIGFGGYHELGGTYLGNMAQLLREEGIDCPGYAYCNPVSMDQVLGFYLRAQKPAILQVTWENGGRHYVLGVGMHGQETVVICDPGSGVVEAKLHMLPRYQTKYQHKKAVGMINGWYMPAVR